MGKRMLKIRGNQISLADSLILGILVVGMFVVFLYGDILVTLEHAMNLLDSVFSGQILEFYEIAAANSTFGHPAVYDLPIYIVFAIWNLPSYFLCRIANVNVLDSFFALLWAKSMILFFGVLSVRVLSQIGQECGVEEETKTWMLYAFISSPIFLVPSLLISQYDIISVTFMLCGFLQYLKNNNKGFVLWFLLANMMKLFAFFIFVPLLLLKEKRIPHIIKDVFVGLTGVLLFKAMYFRNAAYQSSTAGFSEDMLQRLRATGVPSSYGTFAMPIFICIIVMVCIFAYAFKPENNDTIKRTAIYIPFVVYGTFVVFVPINPYWVIIFAPFITLVTFSNRGRARINLLLEAIIASSLLYRMVVINYEIFGKSTMKNMLLGKLICFDKYTKYSCVRDLIATVGLEQYLDIFYAILVAAFLAMLIINFPKENKIDQQHESIKGVIRARLLIVYAISVSMVFVYVKSSESVVYDASNGTEALISGNVLQENGDISEELSFDSNVKIRKIQFGVNVEGFDWRDSSIITVSIKNSNNKTLCCKDIPINTIKNGVAEIKTKGVSFIAGENYKLEINAKSYEELPAYVVINTQKNENKTSQAGKDIDGDIWLKIYGEYEGGNI